MDDKSVLLPLWRAWYELNTIRARDGVPYQYDGTKSSVDEDYFSSVVDDCAAAIEHITGQPPMPWEPK